MLKRIEQFIFPEKISFINLTDYELFEKHRFEINLHRTNIFLTILFFIDILLIFVDFIAYWNFIKINAGYFYLFISHIIILGVNIFWFIYYNLFLNKLSFATNKKITFIFSYIIILWCVFMSINNLTIAGQISAYIIVILLHASIIFLPPAISISSYLISFLLFCNGLSFVDINLAEKISCIVNSSISNIFAIVVSIIIYKSFIDNYINNKKIIESNLKLEEMEKARIDFFTNISHELKTPLNIIYTAQQMIDITIKNDKYNNYNIHKYMKMIKQNSYRLTRLVSNLIDITKIDACCFELKPINADIIKIVEDITLSVSQYIENQGINLIFDTNVEEKVIACDPDKIERIMLNLLSNAVKFTDKGGYILVNINCIDDKVIISVADSGIGITEEMLGAIFDRFVQVNKANNKKTEGSGIGLALVKSLVELHGGTITVESTLGVGSKFIISLPDKNIVSEEPHPKSSNFLNSSVEKINIEFSDIYE